ncbi:partial ROK family transcriptional repressor with glucose kinase domain [Porphyromonas gingivalis ATCC 33277]|uniref:Partial ROK family transcriptional repressor with glucose kinase domain n=1 Tax=Porphyromonas gingivalis (strain ATCC 33277 / DSM 20709 / CIP 103683 / JCM 12257 / NCTC 11834 / 2561) TaxID=431947 RepID=B2RHQ5_PORG3|nr:partial ROK family transcriptional repressor with glucose kinase domain [Porphyromonas gingivalis ATCC 33277]
MAFYLHLKPNDLEAAPSSRSLCSRRITKEYDLQLLVIFMVCSLRSNWRDLITSKDVYDAAISGDGLAQEIFETTGAILGEAFADFVTFSSPEAIILFGGLTKAGDLLMNPIRHHMEKNVLNIYRGKTKLLFSQLKESDAAVLGASALGWEAK